MFLKIGNSQPIQNLALEDEVTLEFDHIQNLSLEDKVRVSSVIFL